MMPKKRRNRSAGMSRQGVNSYSYEPTAHNSPMAGGHMRSINCSQCMAEGGEHTHQHSKARVIQPIRNPFQPPSIPFSSLVLNKENQEYQADPHSLDGNGPYSPHQQQASSPPCLDITRLNQKVDDIYQALSACIQTHCVSKEEFQDVFEIKVNREELEVLML